MRPLCLLAFLLFASDQVSNLSGRWHLNVEKSTWGKKPRPQSSVVQITHQEPRLQYSGDVTGQAGEPNTTFSFEGDIDAKQHPVATPSGEGTIVYRRVDADTIESETRSNDGKFVETSRTSISKDGKTLTRKLQVKAPPGNVSWTEVYDRQP